MQGLERVVVLPWSEFYSEAHVMFIACAVRNAAESLLRPLKCELRCPLTSMPLTDTSVVRVPQSTVGRVRQGR